MGWSCNEHAAFEQQQYYMIFWPRHSLILLASSLAQIALNLCECRLRLFLKAFAFKMP